MACLASAVFFLKFWRDTRDRLFAMFAVSFCLLALDRVVVVAFQQQGVSSPAQYLVRLAAFVVIIVAIVEKNRRTNHRQ
jgi:hypothetical protein